MKLTPIHGQPSWRFSSDCIDAAITRQGGHLAPVSFQLPHAVVQPFSVAPWAKEKVAPETPPLLRSLRGDFFCAPFGGNDKAWRGEKHPAHGESAQANWQFESLRKSKTETELHLSLETKVRPGMVDKILRLRQGETNLYCRHLISKMSGKMNLGHHATLKFPDAEGSGLISTSAISHGQIFPFEFERPAQGGYNSLKQGAEFSRLDQVPARDGTMADLSQYPARRGFEDLAMVTHEAAPDFAWTAVVFPAERYVWFALKDPRVLRSTVFWISNGGRHYAPWNGRHVSVMGLEDVTSYFHCGLAESVQPNPISKKGIPTCLTLKSQETLSVNYIMGVAAIPRGWSRVKAITPEKDGITLQPEKGKPVHVPVDFSFLYEKTS